LDGFLLLSLQDVSAFADDNFDPAEWINKMYNSAPTDSKENKEVKN
jgi:hypothetical protein